MQSFVEMAGKGLFSYNTEMLHGDGSSYYLVATPDKHLRVSELPSGIRGVLERTRATLRFSESIYVPEAMTESW